MRKALFHTSDSYAPLLVRLSLGVVLFGHGAQKLLGWFGGAGFEGSMKYFTEMRGMPWVVGFLVILIESFGALAIIAGVATRFFAIAIFAVMSGIIFTTFHQFFFMNWFGSQPEEGYEFFLLAVGMAASLIFSGAGKWSVDRLISRASFPS